MEILGESQTRWSGEGSKGDGWGGDWSRELAGCSEPGLPRPAPRKGARGGVRGGAGQGSGAAECLPSWESQGLSPLRLGLEVLHRKGRGSGLNTGKHSEGHFIHPPSSIPDAGSNT